MSKLKQLESKKLIKELEFIESDYNYKNELVSEADSEFIKSLNLFLERHPQLKEIFDRKINKKIEEIFIKKQEDIQIIIENSEKENIEEDYVEETSHELVKVDPKTLKIKKLYREIVKATHPDRVTNEKLNELYLKATSFYNKNDFAGTYSICNELNILFEIEDDERQFIIEKINSLRERISFMESTFTWQWFNSVESEKERMLIEYLKSRLNN